YLQRIVDTLRDRQASSPDLPTLALALATLGTVLHERGDDMGADANLEEAARLIEMHDKTSGTGLVKLNIAIAAQEAGDNRRARALARDALKLLEREHDRRGVALSLAHLGGMAMAQRELVSAHDYLSRSLQMNSEIGDRYGLAFVFDRFAVLAALSGV